MVTIRSIFGGSAGAAEGSGFVLNNDGEIVTNAHVVTDESSGKREPAKEVFVEFPDRNVVAAEIVGFDPFADVALLKVEPDGFTLHPLELGDDSDLQVGQPVAAIGSPFGEQQSLSSGIVSADRPLGQIADPVPDRGRDPDRRLDQPRQLRRPAARRRRPGDRHQPADRDQLRRQRRRRLRGAGLGDQALGRPAGGERQRRIRLHRGLQPGALPAARRPSSASTPPSAGCWPKSCPAARPRRRACEGGDRQAAVPGRRIPHRRRRDPRSRRPQGGPSRRSRPPDRRPRSPARR